MKILLMLACLCLATRGQDITDDAQAEASVRAIIERAKLIEQRAITAEKTAGDQIIKINLLNSANMHLGELLGLGLSALKEAGIETLNVQNGINTLRADRDREHLGRIEAEASAFKAWVSVAVLALLVGAFFVARQYFPFLKAI